MYKKYILWMFLGISVLGYSQNITIKDKESNEPLEAVTLTSENGKIYSITNIKGQADISDFVGNNKISIQSLGYETVIMSYNQLELASFQLSLSPSLLKMDEIVVSANRFKQHSVDNHNGEMLRMMCGEPINRML